MEDNYRSRNNIGGYIATGLGSLILGGLIVYSCSKSPALPDDVNINIENSFNRGSYNNNNNTENNQRATPTKTYTGVPVQKPVNNNSNNQNNSSNDDLDARLRAIEQKQREQDQQRKYTVDFSKFADKDAKEFVNDCCN